MSNTFTQKNLKSSVLVILTTFVIISGFASISSQTQLKTQTLDSVLPEAMVNEMLFHSPNYSDFEIQTYPILNDFVDRYETLADLLANMEEDFNLTYDLGGDQNYYGQLSYNESPLALLTKTTKNLDNTYQCFERTLLVALWAEQKFGAPPLILSFFTNDPDNIRMNHSTYVYEVEGL